MDGHVEQHSAASLVMSRCHSLACFLLNFRLFSKFESVALAYVAELRVSAKFHGFSPNHGQLTAKIKFPCSLFFPVSREHFPPPIQIREML